MTENGWDCKCRKDLKKENDMKKWAVYGYMFDCDEFTYNSRQITGLCCEVKINPDISEEDLDCVAVEITKKNGFIISIRSRAKNVVVQPYKIYALALCSNLHEEPIEITEEILDQYSDYIIDSIHCSAEAMWLLDES